MPVSDQQRAKIKHLINTMSRLAANVGSMHSYWDIIGDMDNFLSGNKTVASYTAEQWIEYAETILKEDYPEVLYNASE